MSDYGLEVWDANGNKTLSITDRLTRVLGSVPYDGSMKGSTGTINISEPGIIFAYACAVKSSIELTDTQVDVGWRILRIDQVNRAITYRNINAPIIYGVY